MDKKIMNKIDRKFYNKNYKLKNKIKLSILNKIYYKLHKSEIKKQQKEYYIKNKKKILNRDNNYNTKKYYSDINFKIKTCLRHRINIALKGITKSEKTMKLVGCSIEFLKQHLEKQFTKGMSFKNYGKWHIDHIKPCAKFDLSKPSEQRKCFNYTNLQPLWAKDNLKKSNKR
jgi:hypothetical protein